jgi:four helix bundle protein
MSREQEFEDRLINFSQSTLLLCRKIPETTITRPIITQLVRSATSIGANYCEANNASSKRDFKNKIFICKKESQETKYWLKLVLSSSSEGKDEINKLIQECHEFCLIFQKIVATIENNGK